MSELVCSHTFSQHLSGLCVSVVNSSRIKINHRDTESPLRHREVEVRFNSHLRAWKKVGNARKMFQKKFGNESAIFQKGFGISVVIFQKKTGNDRAIFQQKSD